MLLAFSCSVEELNTPESNNADRVFARIESVDETATRVYADENLKVLWDADDRISLFKKSTYNKQYRFTGTTGANSGEFVDVNPDAVVTGNPLDNVYSVYPYKSETTISNDGGVISTTLPAEQTYREGTFGVGANTMVSATPNTELVFKNLCGYIVLKLYGEDVSVASITLTGKNNEPLAGNVNVTAAVGEDPSFAFTGTASTSLILNCPTPVTLGSTAEQATTFWLAVPPTTFTSGFTVRVTDKNGGTFEKSSSSKTVISRNSTFRMKPLAVEIEAPSQPNNVIYYTTSDGSVLTLSSSASFGANVVSHDYSDGRGVITFDGDVTIIGENSFYNQRRLESISIPNSVLTIGDKAFFDCSNLSNLSLSENLSSIGNYAFYRCSALTSFSLPGTLTNIGGTAFFGCSSLASLIIPESVTTIGNAAFADCSSLMSFGGKYASPDGLFLVKEGVIIASAVAAINGSLSIPEDVVSIGNYAFYNCKGLTSFLIPENLSSIGQYAFSGCSGLASLIIPETVTTINSGAFSNCTGLTSIEFPETFTSISMTTFSGCSSLASLNIPESVTTIGYGAFAKCSGLTSLSIPESVETIGNSAFSDCTSLTSITMLRDTPPVGAAGMFSNTNNCPIYVNAENVVNYLYTDAAGWGSYSSRIQPLPGTLNTLLDKFNPNQYLIYRANKTEYNEGRDYYSVQSHMPGISGAKVEMKFQLADGTNKTLACDNVGSDYSYGQMKMKDGHFIWSNIDWDDDEYDFSFDVLLSDYGLSESDLYVFNYDSVNSSLSLNNQTWECQHGIMSFGHLFVEYYSESDEGRRTVYKGVPDGSKLYYVKTWDENDNLTSLSFATTVRNPKSGNNEYCWFSYYPETGKLSYDFANDAENQGGYLGGY